MFRTLSARLALAAGATLLTTGATAAVFSLGTADPTNGLYHIYSTSLDSGTFGVPTPCGGGSPSYCAFFGGDPPAGSNISFSPSPTGVVAAVPGGIAGPPPSGSNLDVSLSGPTGSCVAIVCATLNGGVVTLAPTTLVIQNAAGPTTITTSGAGFQLTGLGTGYLSAVNGSGEVEFLVNNSPGLAADFSTLGAVVTGCSGPLCALLGSLTLDMVRYRMFLDFNPDFADFAGTFIGQTANGSLVYGNLSSTFVPVPAAVWLLGSAVGLLGWVRRKAIRA